ncbi:MAG: nucleotidyl transferase AbiEii/AbiGii toxin family protein [Acidobacteriota bacterium]
MKDQAIEVAKTETTDHARRNRLREYLQHALLRQLFERDLLEDLIFHGGTALRVIHGLARFSEDLDFHLSRPDQKYSAGAYLDDLRKDLQRSGYRVVLKPRLEGNVQSCMFGFERLLYECDLSPHENQKLNIRLEIDVNPPQGFRFERALINTYFPFVVLHHDKPSFMAGKLHAILQRRFPKGRDFYDVLFYLGRWKAVSPNIPYLNNALKQTGYRGNAVAEHNWKKVTALRVRAVDWVQIQKDIEPFLLRPEDLKAFRKEFLLQLLEEN